MDDCEKMLSRGALLQNAIKRRNFLHDGNCVQLPYGQRDLDSLVASSNTHNGSTIDNGNNGEDASTDSNGSVSIVNNTSEVDNAVNGINGKINAASNSSDIGKDSSLMVPFSIYPNAISVKKPLSRLDYSVRSNAVGSLPRCNSDLWTLLEQDESDTENDGDDDGDAAIGDDDDDKKYDNGDSDYDNENVVGDGKWWVLKKNKENNHLGDVKGSETETVRERTRRGGSGVCDEREKKNNEKQNNNGSGDEKSGGGSITKEESKAGWQEDGEKRRKWEAIRQVKEEGETEEKKKEQELEALTPNCYSSNEYEFETASEEIGLLEVKVEKQLCGATVHSPTMLRLTTTTTPCHDSAPTNVTWSDPCRKGLGNNLKKTNETAMPKRLETEFNTDNHYDENVPLVDTVTSQQRDNHPALAVLPSPLLPCPPSPAPPLATISSPAPTISLHSNHPKHPHHHHQNFLQQQQNHNQHQQPHAHFLLPSEANLTVSTHSVPQCGNNSPVSTSSASSTSSSSSSSYSSSSPPSPSSPSSPQTTHTSVVEEGKSTQEVDPFHTEVLDSNPDYPTTGHSINDIIKMSLEDYVVLKDEENRHLSVDVLPNANNKPRQSYSKMVSQNILNGTENVEGDVQSTNALKTNLRKAAAKKRQRKQVIPNQTKADDEKSKKDIEDNKKSVRDGFFIILSGMYGLLLVVLGAVIPISETFANLTTLYFFDAFYIYLYIGSCLFILYVYTFLLRRNTKTMGHRFSFYRQWSRSLNRSWSFGRRSEKNGERNDGRHRRNFTTDVAPHNPNGSFYLRLGAIGFGIGGMIHSGLQLGQHLQLIGGSNDCDGLMQIVKPLFHLVFTFVQLYFVFLNPKVCIHRYKALARFGLMHMCGTNICVWFRNIVVETLHEMHSGIPHSSNGHGSHGSHGSPGHGHPLVEHHQNNHTTHPTILMHTAHQVTDTHHIEHSHNSSLQLHSHHNGNVSSKLIAAMVSTVNSHGTKALKTLPDVNCYWNKMMGKVVEQAGPYLYPCSIEYSLICAGIMFVLWQQVGRGPKPIFTKINGQNADDDSQESRSYRLSVDCGGSSRGLFLGILLFVGAVITMVAFYVLVHKENMTITALALVHLSEIIIYLLGLVATITAAWRMRGLAYKPGHASVLENVLILISLTGVFIFCLFGIIAALFHEESGITNTLSIASNLMMIIQSIVQTVFMAVGAEMQAYTQAQERQKPGRELVTFLILCNLSLWGINTFETQRAEHNPIQTDFYGHMAWAILTHISVPLGIFFRFHSTVCLSNIWKNAWKIRHH